MAFLSIQKVNKKPQGSSSELAVLYREPGWPHVIRLAVWRGQDEVVTDVTVYLCPTGPPVLNLILLVEQADLGAGNVSENPQIEISRWIFEISQFFNAVKWRLLNGHMD